MAEPFPNREDVRPGMTVEIVQDAENNPGEPIIGDVAVVRTEEHSHPDGIEVRLESGAVGRVREIHPEGDDGSD